MEYTERTKAEQIANAYFDMGAGWSASGGLLKELREMEDGYIKQLADAQAAIAALQRERDELKELTNVICGHCCEDETEDNAMTRNDFPVLRTYRFSIPEGVVYLELPHPLSVASSDELIQWLSIIEHQVQRSPLTPNEATAK